MFFFLVFVTGQQKSSEIRPPRSPIFTYDYIVYSLNVKSGSVCVLRFNLINVYLFQNLNHPIVVKKKNIKGRLKLYLKFTSRMKMFYFLKTIHNIKLSLCSTLILALGLIRCMSIHEDFT